MVPDQLSKILEVCYKCLKINFFKFIGNLTKKILGFDDPEKPNSPDQVSKDNKVSKINKDLHLPTGGTLDAKQIVQVARAAGIRKIFLL